ncbi:Gfo/Idh/MocA family protein [Candidatus Latescibacterota bacterium]
MSSEMNRRKFLEVGSLGSLSAAMAGLTQSGCAGPMRRLTTQADMAFSAPPMKTVRIGYVGVGGMGTAHVRNLLRIEGAEIKAVCDIVPDKVVNAQNLTEEAGQKRPAGYNRGPTDYIRMCNEADLDLVYTATPWELHVPVCVAAMKAGKHAATEVPAAVTIDECWQLVDTAEKYKKHCVMMENCCYDRSEMTVLNMVRKGLFGEILHAECGYLHDLRDVKFSDSGEGLWRIAHSINSDANLYPTHGLGPIAQYMNINRGDKFDYIVSMSSNSRGLNLYAEELFGADDSRAKQKYALGDVNVSMIKTANGLTITLVHDCSSPRPYDRINLVQGTKGIFRGYPDRIHVENRSPKHQWEDLDGYMAEYEHPLWKAVGDSAKGAGHGGMDYIEDYRLIKCLREGLPTDMNVYDAAAWSVVTELSKRSVANKSRPMDFPDFTRGKWKTAKPLGIVQG